MKSPLFKDSERTKCEIWTRVMGYYRQIADANIGKRQEARDRLHFKEEKAMSEVLQQ